MKRDSPHSPNEPDLQTASGWWSDLSNIWTPIGWKDHLTRFNVFWDGMILAEPCLNPRAQPWKDQGAQLSFIPNLDPSKSTRGQAFFRQDDGSVRQGWTDSDTPVLWTEWYQDGVLLRQEVFAHIAGGGDVKTGDELLFAWIRLSVRDVSPALPTEPTHGFNVFIDRPHIEANMNLRNNIHFRHDQQLYSRKLTADRRHYSKTRGFRILEPDGRVRFGVAPRQDSTALFEVPTRERLRKGLYVTHRLHVGLPARRGARADLLLPVRPAERSAFDAELKLGFDAAEREAGRYWKRITACRTRVRVPEPFINEVIRQSVRFSNVLTEKNPATGKVCKISGSWAYANLWATPCAMDLSMMMDTLGHHAMVGRYLDIFREEQGTITPPGDAYERHPGYLSTPAAYKSVDWLSDNGAVLTLLCMHALLSGDRAFTEQVTDCIVKSCEWIRCVRQKKGHGGVEGVLPPAVATDRGTKIQAVWSVGWNYLGLTKAVQVLKQVGHPRAAEFAREAKDYQAAFLKAYRRRCSRMPTWTDARGIRRRFLPTALAGESRSESRHAFYLDTGPLFLVFAGLMDAGDPLMKDACRWFREGPHTKYYRRDSHCWQVPVLDHELSSCEPAYSWNVFHSWQLGDRPRFLEGMYSLFAGSLSRQTCIACETRGGITGNVFSTPLAITLARLAVIDDQLRNGELHLLRLTPRAWVRSETETIFEKMPTVFGPVTLRFRLGRDPRTLRVFFTPRFRECPKRIVLHIPPMDPPLTRVTINGKPVAVKGRETLAVRQP
ncbi:MAG: hypothetical protein HY343_06525 [Lentisphaerae bacterium]|nr:hypothetical protein [Lentisphaerota bacterium]